MLGNGVNTLSKRREEAMGAKTETITLPIGECTVTRKGSGPQLLLLHGGGGSIADHPVADRLAEKFEVIAPTHPGFNGTKIPDHFDGMPELVHFYLDPKPLYLKMSRKRISKRSL